MARLDSITKSISILPGSYYASSGSATLTSGNNTDAEGRRSTYLGNADGSAKHVVETQAAATNNLTKTLGQGTGVGVGVGAAGRYYLNVRGEGHVRLYKDGVAQGSTVDFDTSDLWAMADTGLTFVHGIGEDWRIRVWGPADVHTGVLYFLHRAVPFAAADYAVGTATTTTDAGSINANVLSFHLDDRDDTWYEILNVTPGDMEGKCVPLAIGRIANGFADGSSSDGADPTYGGGSEKDGTFFGSVGGGNNPTGSPGTYSSVNRLTPRVFPVTIASSVYPPPGNVFNGVDIGAGEEYELFMFRNTTAGGFGNAGDALIDVLTFVRPCADIFFDAYNTGNSPSFSYSWDDPTNVDVDHYAIVVTGVGAEPLDIDGTVTQVIDPATSPTNVTVSGDAIVYLLAVTSDGDFACFDYDEVDVVAAFGPVSFSHITTTRHRGPVSTR